MTSHSIISYFKSGIRGFGYGVMMGSHTSAIVYAGLILLFAEILGVLEEAFPGAYEGTLTDHREKPVR